jgi:hypothetical protein
MLRIRWINCLAGLSGLWLSSSCLMAHPGHEVLPAEPESLVHYLLEPDHAIPPLVIGATIILSISVARYLWRRRQNEAR